MGIVDVKVDGKEGKAVYAVADPSQVNIKELEEKTQPEQIWLVYRKVEHAVERTGTGAAEAGEDRRENTPTGTEGATSVMENHT